MPEFYLLYLLLPSLSIASVSSFKTTYIFLPQTHCIEEPRQPQDGGRITFSIYLLGLFGLHAPGPGLFLASVWPNTPFTSENLLSMKVFV